MSVIWNFPDAKHGQNQGSNEPGMEPFAYEPLNNLAREIVQNSLDARSGKEPVVVEFHKFTIETKEYPGIESLFNHILLTQQEYRNNDRIDKKDRILIDNLVRCLTNPKMSMLRISDFHTSGLWGSSNPGTKETPWFAFIKGAGRNQKNENSGGSKGLGKNAIFVNSLIRSMIVSTYAFNQDLKTEEFAWTGIAKLISRTLFELDPTDPDPDYTQGVGYCVNDDEYSKGHNSPIKELKDLDYEFSRVEMGYGTDIFVPCFASDEKWDDVMALEVIYSFMPAILNGDLIVKFTYDNDAVERLINASRLPYELAGRGKDVKEVKSIYDVLTSQSKAQHISYTAKPGFEMELHILQDNQNGQNNIYQYRFPTKMRIRQETKEGAVPFTGVLFITGEEITKRLRSVEDATHKKWVAGAYKDTKYTYKEIKEAIDAVNNFLSEQCNLFGLSSTEETSYFDVEGWKSEEEIYDMSLDENTEIGLPTEEVVFNTKQDPASNPKRRPFKKKGNQIDDNGSAESNVLDLGKPGEGEELSSHPTGHNHGKGGEIHGGNTFEPYDPNQPEKIVVGRRRISTVKARMPAICPEDGIFDLVFTPEKTGTKVEIEVLKAGVEGENEKTKILSANYNGVNLELKNNKIQMEKIDKGTEYRIHLKLDEINNYVWEVNVDAEE